MEKIRWDLYRKLRNYPVLYHQTVKSYHLARTLRISLLDQSSGPNALRCLLSAMMRQERSGGRPILLTIEPTNICDQRCTICETGLGILGRKPRNMTFEEFKHILDQFDKHLRTIYFYFMGESFLNKDAYRMIRYAADRGIYVSACTNGNRINPEALVESGIADIQFQIAGTTPEIHATYRVGGDLNKVIQNIRETVRLRNDLRDKVPRPYPMKIGIGFILLKPNEHQVTDFELFARKLEVDEWQIIDPCVRTAEQGKELLPTNKNHWIYDPDAFERGTLKPRIRPKNYCEWIYSTVTIQVDGNVVPCCRDPKGQWVLGNVLNENIYHIWNGKKFRALRRAVTRKQEALELCNLCEGYTMPKVSHG
ncbi:MAG: radical SAM/SPASM domain-containing protein [Candidatus Hodarchaeota archaeon]